MTAPLSIFLVLLLAGVLETTSFNSPRPLSSLSSPSSPRVTVRAAKKKFVPFDPDKFLQNFVDKARAAAAGLSRVDALKQELMSSVTLAKGSDTLEAEERVRRVFQELEKAAPSSPQLLDDPSSAELLDGEWELIYTVAEYGAPGEAAKVIEEAEKRAAAGGGGIGGGEEAGKPRGIGGAVNATGLNVDTTGKDTRTTQTFDVAASRVANDIVKPFLGGPMKSRLQVSGPFTRSPANARRANVRFDTLELSVEYTPVKVTIGWLFPIVYALRPDERQESWLETTHLSSDLRLARGNKGSIFVLGRNVEDASWLLQNRMEQVEVE